MAFKTDRTKCGTETMETTKCMDKDLHRKLTRKKYFRCFYVIKNHIIEINFYFSEFIFAHFLTCVLRFVIQKNFNSYCIITLNINVMVFRLMYLQYTTILSIKLMLEVLFHFCKMCKIHMSHDTHLTLKYFTCRFSFTNE